MNIFGYSNIQYRILYIRIQIFNFLFMNIFYSRIRPICSGQIYSKFVFAQFAKNEYIRYSYSTNLLRTNIFDIRICLVCQEPIYSIFIFGEILISNIFVFVFGLKFNIRVTLLSLATFQNSKFKGFIIQTCLYLLKGPIRFCHSVGETKSLQLDF